MPAPRTLLSHLNGVHVFSTPSATYNASQGHRSRIRRRRRPAVPTPRQSPSLSTTILGVRDGDMSTMPIVPCCGMHRWLPGNINRVATHRRQPQWRSRPPNLSIRPDPHGHSNRRRHRGRRRQSPAIATPVVRPRSRANQPQVGGHGQLGTYVGSKLREGAYTDERAEIIASRLISQDFDVCIKACDEWDLVGAGAIEGRRCGRAWRQLAG
ncbi:hypothetical protein BJ912DRAFT_1062077 [Pholiota molesta]|nr:hypothetical protein BJ912DRAFT_1062077 [Pholiota molesta]